MPSAGRPFHEGDVLPGKEQRGRPIVAPQRAASQANRSLHRVARPPDFHIGNEAQARRVLYRLVRGAVLAEPDRVVRKHVDHPHAHQRRKANRVARIVGEDEERAAVGNEAAVQRDPFIIAHIPNSRTP